MNQDDVAGSKPVEVSSSDGATVPVSTENDVKAITSENSSPPAASEEKVKSTKTTLMDFYDILGGIAFFLVRDAIILPRMSTTSIFSSGNGEVPITTIACIAKTLEFVLVGDDQIPYIFVEWPHAIQFTDYKSLFTSYLTSLFKLYQDGCTIVQLPETVGRGDLRVPDPDKLGFPLTEFNKYYVPGFNGIDTIWTATAFAPTNVNFIFNVNVLEPRQITSVREDMYTYARVRMPRIRNNIITFLNFSSGYRINPEYIIPPRENTLFHPMHDFSYSSYCLPLLPHRTELTVAIVSQLLTPKLPIEPIPENILSSLSSVSMTRTSVLSSLSRLSYSDSMKEDYSAILCGFLNPGMLKITVNFSEMSAADTDLRGLAAVFAKALFSYSEATYHSTITRQTVFDIEDNIRAFGINRQLLQMRRIDVIDDLPLNSVEVRPNTGYSPDSLQALRTDFVGGGWMLGGGENPVNDPIDELWQEGVIDRVMYGPQVDDYEIYLANQEYHRNAWPNRQAIINFGNSLRRSIPGVDAIIRAMLDNLCSFLVRLNEYMRFNWHSGFKPTYAFMHTLIGPANEHKCIPVTISARSILTFIKCVGHAHKLERTTTIIRQIEIEADTVQYVTLLRWAYSTLRRLTETFDVVEEYGSSRLWKLTVSIVSSIHPSNNILASYFNALVLTNDTSRVPAAYGAPVSNSPLGIALRRVTLNERDEIRLMLSRSFGYKLDGTRAPSITSLRQHAVNNIVYTNNLEEYARERQVDILPLFTQQIKRQIKIS